MILCIIFPFPSVILLLVLVSQVLPSRVVLACTAAQKLTYFFRVTSQLHVSGDNEVLEDMLSMEFISNPLISLELDYPDLVPVCGVAWLFLSPRCYLVLSSHCHWRLALQSLWKRH